MYVPAHFDESRAEVLHDLIARHPMGILFTNGARGVAHAHGKITIRDDERYVRGVVARLTRIHEAPQPVPWKMTDGPKEFIDAMLQAIVGIEIEITRLVGKFKLSQNKEVRDIESAGEALRQKGEHLVGDAMLAVAADKRK